MAVPFYKAIPGEFILLGKQPDGDSVRFIADDPTLFDDLHRAFRIKPTRSDGSVQLRFEAIDAPEIHYGAFAQALGAEARDALLQQLGFTDVGFGGAADNVVTASTPETIRGVILTKAADANGRPISYILTESDVESVQPGEWNYVDPTLLQRTSNWFLLEKGYVYYTVYTSTPALHRKILKTIASKAREDQLGVWNIDATADFILDNQESIGPNGSLILPKLFRRCSDYLRAINRGFEGELTDWLRANSSGARTEDDQVLLDGTSGSIPLSTLIMQRNHHIGLTADLLSITFVEK
jgi:hypothetical protein